MTDIYRVAFFGHRRIYNIREIEEKLVPIINKNPMNSAPMI